MNQCPLRRYVAATSSGLETVALRATTWRESSDVHPLALAWNEGDVVVLGANGSARPGRTIKEVYFVENYRYNLR